MTGPWKRNSALFISKSARNKKKSEHSACRFQETSLWGSYLHMGNGAQAVVEAIGTFDLVLPSGLVLKLNNCYFAPSIVRGVVSFSCLLDLGFKHTVASNGISVSLNGVFYFSAISVNAHIGKTRMQKLQREGLLESINEESFDKCESCISGKMTKKPFNSNIERATDLLGLIHTDVCGPLRHVSRKVLATFLKPLRMICQGRYGYVLFGLNKNYRYGDFLKEGISYSRIQWGEIVNLEDDHIDTLPLKTTSEFPGRWMRKGNHESQSTSGLYRPPA
ncbi:retrotransposon protein, putative, ty1-copia subclass [Tanacetum coccineum]